MAAEGVEGFLEEMQEMAGGWDTDALPLGWSNAAAIISGDPVLEDVLSTLREVAAVLGGFCSRQMESLAAILDGLEHSDADPA